MAVIISLGFGRCDGTVMCRVLFTEPTVLESEVTQQKHSHSEEVVEDSSLVC